MSNDASKQKNTLPGMGVEESEDAEVYVVAANYMDDPHPHVEAVYDNKDAAERHIEAITDSNSISAPIAWISYDMEIKSDIEECPVCQSDADRRLIEHKSKIIDDKERCPDCRSEVPL